MFSNQKKTRCFSEYRCAIPECRKIHIVGDAIAGAGSSPAGSIINAIKGSRQIV